jgi:preprotein translocase subunit SecA
MIGKVLRKIFGTKNERELKRLIPIVERINALEPKMMKMPDYQLRRKTYEFKERIEKGESLDALLPEAFAVVREVARRTLGERPFDVQLMGAIVLHEGKIAEMATGEGKTLVATMPAYLNALLGKGVHIVTVNDYLARRDAEWMGVIYRFLGLEVGVITHDMDDRERKKAYQADITYGTNNEFGFDYLRDNLKFSLDDCVQRDHYYAIIDEVDSILIDEARTPLIISGPAEESTEKYYHINRIIPFLKKDIHFTIDEKTRTVALTEEGVAKVEELLGVDNLYDPRNIDLIHHVHQALKAHYLFKRDRDYVVKDGKVIIVDEFTGRLMPGRRWSDGLHQAIEAKEGVKIERENQTLATITFQNYFRMYQKLAGMTGTAETEALEFKKIYNLDVVVIPTNRPLIRINYPDVIFKTEKEKFEAVVKEIEALHKIGRPVLVGTTSIEKSERLSQMLKRRGIPHHVLNAKHHEKEAEIIAQAGRFGAVTISTNMAGRGTDILLGGNPKFLAKKMAGDNADEKAFQEAYKKALEITKEEKEKVVSLGGLHVIGTERHESRRIDNQLRGRAGRQGDPGSSRFFLSLEDDLLRIFGGERLKKIMERLGVKDGEPIEHPLISRAIENAQKRVESHNFEIRKYLLEYDNVMNQQREAVYSLRRRIMKGEDLKGMIMEMVHKLVEDLVDTYTDPKLPFSEWDWEGLKEAFKQQFFFPLELEVIPKVKREDLVEMLFSQTREYYEEKEKHVGPELMREVEKFLLLHTLDNHWKEHLLNLDHLKEGIGLWGYAQKDPLVQYKKEGYQMFLEMLDRFREDVVRKLFAVQITRGEEVPSLSSSRRFSFELVRGPLPFQEVPQGPPSPQVQGQIRRKTPKVGRNDPCPCGSGKKYKHCCGK